MSDRPAIPATIKREVLHQSCHRCAVCGFGLSIELAHVIPWRKSKDHSAKNLIALCANCHEMADKQKWNSKDFEVYKKEPWALRTNVAQPTSASQKAMIDMILAKDAQDMDEFQRTQLVQMVGAYVGVHVGEIKIISITPSTSSLIRMEMSQGAAEKLILGFQSQDPRLVSFLDNFAAVKKVVGPLESFIGEAEKQELEKAPRLSTVVAKTSNRYTVSDLAYGLYGSIKLIETARPTVAEKPPVTNVKEEGLESLIFDAMTVFGWIVGKNKGYNREFAVDIEQFATFLETTQEQLAVELDVRNDGPVRRKFLARLQG